MKRILQRVLVVVGVGGGLFTVVETAASARLSANHSEPVVRDTR